MLGREIAAINHGQQRQPGRRDVRQRAERLDRYRIRDLAGREAVRQIAERQAERQPINIRPPQVSRSAAVFSIRAFSIGICGRAGACRSFYRRTCERVLAQADEG